MRARYKKNRVYADTSIFGGVFDPEFERASGIFISQVKQRRFDLVTSPMVEYEIDLAPDKVKELYRSLFAFMTYAEPTAETAELQQAYIDADILSPKSAEDALHVALAVTSECDLIVSWNFKHIVNFKKIPMYNAVNLLKGYNPIQIYSPLEVIEDDQDI